jgi:hypothetical protein
MRSRLVLLSSYLILLSLETPASAKPWSRSCMIASVLVSFHTVTCKGG